MNFRVKIGWEERIISRNEAYYGNGNNGERENIRRKKTCDSESDGYAINQSATANHAFKVFLIFIFFRTYYNNSFIKKGCVVKFSIISFVVFCLIYCGFFSFVKVEIPNLNI